MSTGLKMAASAAIAAAVTAAMFLTLWDRSSPPVPPSDRLSADFPADPCPPRGDSSNGEARAPVLLRPPPDLPVIRGDGVVRGRVATAENVGVGGVVIEARPRPEPGGRRGGDAPPRLDLEEEIRRAVAATHRRVTGTRRATTGSDGRYVLTGLGQVGYYLRAYAPGHAIRAVRGHNTSDVWPGDTVDFEATAIVEVRVLVEGIDPSGSGRVGVLRARDEEGLKRVGASGWSADRPEMRLDPGTWWLQAVQGEDRERMSEPEEVTLEVGAQIQTVVLSLRERPGLRGAIVVNDELDARRAEVYALRFEGDKPPPLDPFGQSRGAIRGRCDLESKRYSFGEIGPGRYYVWITLGSTRVMGSSIVEILDRMVERDIEVGIDDPERYVVVRAIGPDGEPLDARGTSFSASYVGPGFTIGGGVEAIHRRDGSWLIAPDPRAPSPEDHPGGTYRLRVNHQRLGTREVVCDPKTQRELEFRFGEASSLTVTVSGLDENGLSGRASLHLRTHMEPDSITGPVTSARSGGNLFFLDKVQPGDWFIVLVAEGIMVDRMPVTVREGENVVRWALPSLHTVRLEPANKERSIRFGLVRRDPAGDWMHQFAGSARGGGEAVFRFVPPGRYELTGSYEGEDRRILIDVPAQTHVLLE